MSDGPTLNGIEMDEWMAWVNEAVPNWIPRCQVAQEQTQGRYYCKRAVGHGGPCAAVPRIAGAHELERWPTLLAIGLGDALDAVERVTAWAQTGKHPGPKWAGQTVPHQTAKLLGHLGRGLKGELRDEDTGESPFAHVAARALMLLGLALRGSDWSDTPPPR